MSDFSPLQTFPERSWNLINSMLFKTRCFQTTGPNQQNGTVYSWSPPSRSSHEPEAGHLDIGGGHWPCQRVLMGTDKNGSGGRLGKVVSQTWLPPVSAQTLVTHASSVFLLTSQTHCGQPQIPLPFNHPPTLPPGVTISWKFPIFSERSKEKKWCYHVSSLIINTWVSFLKTVFYL